MQYGLQSSSLHYRALYTAQFEIFFERLVKRLKKIAKMKFTVPCDVCMMYGSFFFF